MNLNYIKECTRIVREHNKHENLIVIRDEPKGSTLKAKPNEIGFHLLITM
jgi:hypothetical protein